ncbi:pyrroline-5-carboxylate reductase [Edwardsiella piscicida]|uniref:pyrroline-5-carboxylate reductase n=1 Tax=Edwardsiella piscicida TaxID=1263550 RepID=UPI00370D9629
MEQKIGFIGCGNMGRAILGGLLASQFARPQDILVYNRTADSVRAIVDEYGVGAADGAAALAAAVDIVVLGVKPTGMRALLEEIKGRLRAETIVVSIAAGVTLETLQEGLPAQQKVIRVMPNTPSLVNAGMSSITPNGRVSAEECARIVALFRSFGRAEVVPESLIHAVVGVSGSSPAYVFMFIEAMADAAVRAGMPRAQAYQFAAQAVMGAAKMVLETGTHPAELKDMVCSPGGTTIEAVAALEENGMRASVIEAISRCIAKSEAMSRR